jgi:NAD(P)H-flavin reductase
MLAISREDLGCLFDVLHAEGYRVIGPTVRGGAIVYDEIEGVADLPIGWRDEQAPGRYRLVRREDEACFGYVVGPHSWKQRLFPSREKLYQARRRADGRVGFDPVLPDGPGEAFLGVRACEVAAMEVQDRVFLEGPRAEPRYAARRERALVIGVSCFEPGELCFCTSMNTGPRVDHGVDLAMAELAGVFLFEAGTPRGSAILDRLPTRPATAGEQRSFDEGIRAAHGKMGRSLDPRGLPELLFGNLEHPRWEAVAQRCLACGNCASVCPTCFCSSAHEESSLTGDESTRVRTWDSCFTEAHAEIHGMNFRPTTVDRHRQWLTHKVGSWVSQYGVSGCVGCGRCIAWCPVGIDLTEEIAAIRVDARPPVPMPVRRAPATATDDALVPRAAEVIAVTREAADVVTLHVACDPPLVVAPGQFTMLSLPALGEAAISVSGTWGESIEQTIRAVGAVSGALAALRPGQQLGLRGPYGHGWPLDTARGRPVVVIAGGIGLAPLRGAIRRMLEQPADYPDVRVVYGARTPDDILFTREMLGWIRCPGFRVETTVDRADLSWRGNVGVVTRLLRRGSLPPDATYLICGPEIMMRVTVSALVASGAPAERMFLAMERHMKCAAGFCGRCQYGPFFVCKDGPIFRYDQLALLSGKEGF